MKDKTQITIYIGNKQSEAQDDIMTMVMHLPMNLYQVKQMPTDGKEVLAILDEIRKMRPKLSKYNIEDKWNAKTISKTPIVTIEDETYPAWYIEKDPNKIWGMMKKICDTYIENMYRGVEKQEKFDETAGILLTEDNQKWANVMSKKVKKLIKTPGKLYKEINTWSDDKKTGFMVGWNATNHDTIPDKLRKIAYELEKDDNVSDDRNTTMDSMGPTR